ncbi:collagen alpha-1(XXIII) chain-like [Lepisosteus oculatus]|uniref:collagen alpha-1(XXIII) chain-like n=1 Tax=Lepisosteus oculatus TaxID=7918 RepID=UPI003718F736
MESDQNWQVSPPSIAGRSCKEHPYKKRSLRNCKDLSAVAVCSALSLLSLGVCILAYLRTSELQARVLNLEKERDTHVSAWISLDQMEPVTLGRLDQILEEKLAAHLPRVREAREVPHSCVCPPGPPGARGKRGRNGDPGPPELGAQTSGRVLRSTSELSPAYSMLDFTHSS